MTTDNPTQLENKLEPCPKCLDCWALQVQEQEPPLLAKTVTCGRCGFRAPFDTWQARLPAQPPFKPMCDDPGCWVCKRMAELHLASSQYGWTKRPASTPERPRQIFDAGFAAAPAPVEQEQRRCTRQPWACRYPNARQCAHDTMLGTECPEVCACACHGEVNDDFFCESCEKTFTESPHATDDGYWLCDPCWKSLKEEVTPHAAPSLAAREAAERAAREVIDAVWGEAKKLAHSFVKANIRNYNDHKGVASLEIMYEAKRDTAQQIFNQMHNFNEARWKRPDGIVEIILKHCSPVPAAGDGPDDMCVCGKSRKNHHAGDFCYAASGDPDRFQLRSKSK